LPVILYGCETWPVTLRRQTEGVCEQDPEENILT